MIGLPLMSVACFVFGYLAYKAQPRRTDGVDTVLFWVGVAAGLGSVAQWVVR
jgi:hypothetical protein